jgi:hypothetical protein
VILIAQEIVNKSSLHLQICKLQKSSGFFESFTLHQRL